MTSKTILFLSDKEIPRTRLAHACIFAKAAFSIEAEAAKVDLFCCAFFLQLFFLLRKNVPMMFLELFVVDNSEFVEQLVADSFNELLACIILDNKLFSNSTV